MKKMKEYIKMKRLIFFILSSISCSLLHAQYDSEFWFVVPDASDNHASGFPSRLVFTNSSKFTAYVTIEMPKNTASFPTKEIVVPPLSTRYYYFLTDAQQHIIENAYSTTYNAAIAGANNKGIHIRSRTVSALTSPGNDTKCDIFVYYELLTGGGGSIKNYFPDGQINEINTGAQNNPELYSLFGSNGLGTDFYTVFQWDTENKKLSYPHEATSAFDIVITEDNTTLTITLPKGKFMYDESVLPSKRRGSFTSATTFSVGPFNKGETYRGVPAIVYPITIGGNGYGANERYGRAKWDRLRGVKIHADKKIAVVLTDDSMLDPTNNSYNIGGDQLIPVNLAGKMYFAQKGALDDVYNLENIYLTSIYPNTRIYIDGVLAGTMINPGDSMKIALNGTTRPKAFISSPDYPFIALQLTGTGRELGMAILPSIETCTGSTRVGFSRGVDGPIHLLLLCRTGTEDYFQITTKSSTNVDSLIYPVTAAEKTAFAAAFAPISASNNDWRYQKFTFTNTSVIKVNGSYAISNEKDVFHLGVVNGGTAADPVGGGTRYGYFSNYNVVQASAMINESGNNQHFICYGDKVQIVAKGGVFYKWTPENYLTNALIEDPVAYPPTTMTYNAVVKGYCNTSQNVAVSVVVLPKVKADFTLDTVSGCEPVKVKLRNLSTGPYKYKLDFGDGTSKFERIFYDPSSPGDYLDVPKVDTTFNHSFIAKTAPDSNTYTVKLIAINSSECSDSVQRKITVFPKVTINSLFPDTSGCDSLKVIFRQNTTNAQALNWEYGDETSSKTTSTSHYHIFRNFTNSPVTYKTTLTATTKYFCSDKKTRNITVHPYIRAGFAVDSTHGCGDKPINIFNLAKGGYTNYTLNFGDGTSTSGGASIPALIKKAYSNDSNVVYNHKLLLKISNNGGGCFDTTSTYIRVYPKVDVSIDPNAVSLNGCGPFIPALKSKLNFPKNPMFDSITYKWDFGDGSSSFLKNVTHSYENLDSLTKTYKTRLIASSSYCKDTANITVNVYGRVAANFTNDKSVGCGKLGVNIKDISVGQINERYWMLTGSSFVRNDSALLSRTYLNADPLSPTTKYQNLRLVVRNSVTGCKDTSKVNRITIHPKVTANFPPPSSLDHCSPLLLNLENTSKLPATHFIWNFSDGATSGTSAVYLDHTFENLTTTEQSYNIQLIAYSDSGCYDTLSRPYIVYPKLLSGFTMSKSKLCNNKNYQESVLISNNSLGGMNKYEWDYDGNGFVDQTFNALTFASFPQKYPDNLTSSDVIYYPKLTVSYKGCTDEFIDTIRLHPKVEAIFSSNIYKDCNPLKFQLTNGSKRANKYTWDFSDGTSSNTTNLSLPYEFGNITGTTQTNWVRLIASSDYCSDTLKIDTFKVYSFVKSDFAIDNAAFCSGNKVTAINSSPTWTVHNKWEWGDKAVVKDTGRVNVTHVYRNTGIIDSVRTIKLKVWNTELCADSTTKVVTVYPMVNAKIFVDVKADCNPFTAILKNRTKLPATKFYWSYGDGTSSNVSDTSHTHIYTNDQATDKTRTVYLTAESNKMCASKDSVQLTTHSYVKADFKVDKGSVCSNETVSISENKSVGETNKNWYYNNVLFSPTYVNGAFSKTFSDNLTNVERTDNLQLIVSNNYNCFDTANKQVIVFPKVIADFTATSPDFCNGHEVSFKNNSNQAATTYNWTFGNNASSRSKDTTIIYKHTENNTKIYNVKLEVVSVNLCKAEITKNVSIKSYILADFKLPQAKICSDLPLTIYNTSEGAVAKSSWDFNNDKTEVAVENSKAFTRPFNNPGPTYPERTMKLVITNPEGCKDSAYQKYTIYPKVTADFDFDQAGCHPFTSHFNAKNKTKNATDLNWTFYSFGTSYNDTVTKTFTNYSANDITYNVKLLALSQYQCKDSITRQVTVYHKPVARIKLDNPEGCPPFTPVIENLSKTSKSTFTWDFGDGETETKNDASAPVHVYNNNPLLSSTQAYTLGLKAETEYGCKDYKSTEIRVFPKVTANVGYVEPQCNPNTVYFVNGTTNADDYVWDFADGIKSQNHSPNHLFKNMGMSDASFKVKLVAYSDFGCSDSTYRDVVIYPQPKASFTVTPVEQRFPSATYTFVDSTNNGPWKYSWNFGNGVESNEIPANDIMTYTYPHWGKFKVSLLVENLDHPVCSDATYQNIVLIAPQPIANFDSAKGCAPLKIDFVNKSSDFVEGYTWDFDDGSFSSKVNPTKIFFEPGEYNVKLHVSAEGGTDIHYEKIHVYPRPQVNFVIEPQMVMLPDDYIKGFNSTTKAVRYLWEFGDGDTSTMVNPTHYFKDLGVYTVKLKAWTDLGCIDSMERTNYIQVLGKGKLVYPNAFTPNMSGPSGGKYDIRSVDNDIFYPYHEGVAEYHLEIYNRWGELLFTSNDVYIGWDGYFKNKLAKQDVYVYKVKGKYYNGKTFVKAGDVTLLHKDQ